VDTLTLKLVLTPLLIGLSSLAGRRWGPSVSGWLVGLPFTSGPIAYFLALDHGPAFAAAAAAGTLAGGISQAAFSLAYTRVAFRADWPIALLAGCLGFAAATLALGYLVLPLWIVFPSVLVALVVALVLVPGGVGFALIVRRRYGRWDIPVRMLVATVVVLVLTGFAPSLGPRLTGLLAPFPLYAAILGVFAHHLSGPGAAAGVLHGLLVGLFSFAAFFLILAATIDRAGIALAFIAAVMVALVVQAGSLWMLGIGPRPRRA
jgi:hypothetical protein